MAYFPMCVDLEGADVILVGEGAAAREKLELLLPFGAKVRLFSTDGLFTGADHPRVCLQRRPLAEQDLTPRPALVVVADISRSEQERISTLCQTSGIPVNVVDEPALCSFCFPSLITQGALTVAVSTGGKSPSAAAWLRRQLEQHIPTNTAEILCWAHQLRQMLRREHPDADRRTILRRAIGQALTENRPLTRSEVLTILREHTEKQ